MTYAEKLRHPKWQKKRLEILERDGFKCCVCDKTDEQLHVHHKIYEQGKEPWDYPNENFETLCIFCHEFEEDFKTSYRELVKELLHGGSSYFNLYRVLEDYKNTFKSNPNG